MDKFEKAVDILMKDFADAIVDLRIPRSKKAYILLKSERHREAVSLLLKNVEDTILSTITGVDLGSEIELNYHIACEGTVTLKNRIPKGKPVTKTITDILPGANLYEREVHDLLGVEFVGHLNLERLLLPDNWPTGNFPLRRDWVPPEMQEASFDENETLSTETVENSGSMVNVIALEPGEEKELD